MLGNPTCTFQEVETTALHIAILSRLSFGKVKIC